MIVTLNNLPIGTQIQLKPRLGFRFVAKDRSKASMAGVLTVTEQDANYTLVTDENGVIVPLAPTLRIHHTF